ncbi:MAG TPA: methyltransferase domain-containing protein, partial [Dehalococcoidia bacterium]
MLEYTGERYLPWLDQPQAAYEHLHRYVFAAGLAGGKRVLDLASGEGYGSALLARSAAAVVGIDLDGEAVAHARRRYPQGNLSFLQGSIEAVPLQASAAFDLVVCFEAIEHVQEPEAVVQEARRLLKPDGLFLVSTPNKRTFTEETGRTWHWHTREFSLEEFRELLSRAFPHVALLGQRVLPGSYLWPLDGSPEPTPESRDAVIRWQGDGFVPGEPEAPLFFLAVASAAPFPEGLEHQLSATRHHLVDASARLLLEKDAIQKVAEERETYAKSLEAELEKVRAALEQPSGPAQGALPEPNLEGAAACTVISKNYLPQARVLVDSFLEHHPGVPFYVLLADRLDGCFDPAGERFQLVELDQLAIPEPEWFRFKYTVLEHDTAVKPYFFSYLLEQVGVRKLIYLDPDILVLGSLQEVYALLETHNAVLTPHLTAPVSDGRRPAELDILMAGTYNLGFIGLADSEVTRAFLWWWQDRCYNGCRMAVEEGMHVDQKWIDLAPAFFEGFHVLTHPGYNVAYWNLHERRISFRDGRVWVNGQPGYFFHFSGFDPDNPEQISRHQDRFRLSTLNHATRKLFERYRLLMLDAGYEECRGWPYAFDRFANGVRIPEAARRLVFTMEDEDRRRLGDPFEVTPDRETFFGWLNGRAEEDPNPEAPPVSRLWLHLYRLRRDVQEVFPDLFGAHREAFLRWAAEHGRYEHRLDAAFAPPLPPLPKPEHLLLPFGVNVCGYFNSEKGVGEAGRSVVRALASAGVPYVLNNVVDPLSANVDRTYGAFSAENPFAINVVCMNADATETLLV